MELCVECEFGNGSEMNLFVLVSFKDFPFRKLVPKGGFSSVVREFGHELQLQEAKSWWITRRLFLSDR